MQDVSMFDIIVIAITLLLGLKGLFRGFVKEVFGLIGIVGGIFVASRLAVTVGEKIAPIFALENSASIQLMGFIASLLVFWVVAYLLGTVISKIFSLSGLGIFDRTFGFLFGSFKIFLIFSVIIYALSQVETIKEKLDDKIGDTITYPLLVAGGSYIIKLDQHLPSAQIQERLDSAVDGAKEKIEDVTLDTAKDMIENSTNEIKDKLLEDSKDIKNKAEEIINSGNEEVEKIIEDTVNDTLPNKNGEKINQ